MIEINNLKKHFGKLSVLNEFDFTFEKGQITAVVGPNGSGKTTLIKCILGLIKPDSGKIKPGIPAPASTTSELAAVFAAREIP